MVKMWNSSHHHSRNWMYLVLVTLATILMLARAEDGSKCLVSIEWVNRPNGSMTLIPGSEITVQKDESIELRCSASEKGKFIWIQNRASRIKSEKLKKSSSLLKLKIKEDDDGVELMCRVACTSVDTSNTTIKLNVLKWSLSIWHLNHVNDGERLKPGGSINVVEGESSKLQCNASDPGEMTWMQNKMPMVEISGTSRSMLYFTPRKSDNGSEMTCIVRFKSDTSLNITIKLNILESNKSITPMVDSDRCSCRETILSSPELRKQVCPGSDVSDERPMNNSSVIWIAVGMLVLGIAIGAIAVWYFGRRDATGYAVGPVADE